MSLSFTYLEMWLLFAINAADLEYVVEAVVLSMLAWHCQEGLHGYFFDASISLRFIVTLAKSHTFRIGVSAIVVLFPAIDYCELAFILQDLHQAPILIVNDGEVVGEERINAVNSCEHCLVERVPQDIEVTCQNPGGVVIDLALHQVD